MTDSFTGSAISTVTDEGIMMLPAGFRDAARRRVADGRLLIGLDDDWQCLVVTDPAHAAQQLDDQATHPAIAGSSAAMRKALLRRRFGFVAPTILDPSGAIVIAPWIRERGGIGGSVLLVALGDRFEIWDLPRALETGPSDLRILARLHTAPPHFVEDSHEAALSPVRASSRPRRARKSGVRVQPVPAVQPRHDPIGDGR